MREQTGRAAAAAAAIERTRGMEWGGAGATPRDGGAEPPQQAWRSHGAGWRAGAEQNASSVSRRARAPGRAAQQRPTRTRRSTQPAAARARRAAITSRRIRGGRRLEAVTCGRTRRPRCASSRRAARAPASRSGVPPEKLERPRAPRAEGGPSRGKPEARPIPGGGPPHGRARPGRRTGPARRAAHPCRPAPVSRRPGAGLYVVGGPAATALRPRRCTVHMAV